MNDYVKQLKEFKNYMNACFDVLMEYGNNGDIDSFYQSEFEITFRGKKVTLANGAEVFQAIEEIIQTEIDDCEEV
jgi:uncharacterized membrane-anchored protein